jgi:hypothetical protein
MLLQRKNDSRDASSRSVTRDVVPVAAAGTFSMRKRNCELTSSRSSADWMPRSKLPSLRPDWKNGINVRRSASLTGRR